MRWLDLAGIPGSGKSTIAYPLWPDRAVGWDGLPPPAYWRQYLDELTNLFMLIRTHLTLEAAIRMNIRTAGKMAAVERMQSDKPFVQTGHLQRILGFGWRLHDMGADVHLISRALWLMPASIGAVFLEAEDETLIARNRARRLVPETAHEDRSHQIRPMKAAIAVAKKVLNERKLPILELDVQRQSADAARAELVAFAAEHAGNATSVRSGCEDALLSTYPIWWRR